MLNRKEGTALLLYYANTYIVSINITNKSNMKHVIKKSFIV
nr:MAG TPA_asm: hypothetical protein [Bacteriophage sp.]